MMINNMNSCLPSSSQIDSSDLNQLNNASSMSNAQLISSTVIGSPNSASNSEDTLLLKILDEFSDSPPAHDTNSPNSISSTTLHQRSTAVPSSSDSPGDLNEKLAISAIQKQLMSFDTINSSNLQSGSNQNMGMQSQMQSNSSLLSNDIEMMNSMSSNSGLNNNYGPPPAYQQAAPSSSAQMGRMQPAMLNSSSMNSDQVSSMSSGIMTNSMNSSMISSGPMNNGRMQVGGQGMQQQMSGNQSFLQQQQQQNNGMMNNQMMRNQMAGGHMIAMNSPTGQQRLNLQQQQKQPIGNVENRKQKMQFTQQPMQQAPKRFVGQNPQIQIQPSFSNQPNFNQQQSVNSPQAQQVFLTLTFDQNNFKL